ncbi:hypothetical protein [Palleronia caenipelagi]|uniref:Sulfotransferase domain-containing protein n=1 Tax=Palleronia caenipelagi TaxID=2489174 RepID=A0A547QAY4_9RHOB|nr:hypothetical protein [Palleronia caenipelagi]TRD23532.1 hypothetical protein FEV53_00510 [Palleronia caenipelagi]
MLREFDRVYPTKLSGGVWHQDIFERFGPRHKNRLAQLSEGPYRPVLSYETGYLADADMCRKITAGHEAVDLMLVVRHPVKWLNSWRNQMLKSHRTTIDDFRNAGPTNAEVFRFFDLTTHIARWKANASVSSVNIVEYGADDLIDTFLDWIGVGRDRRGDFQKNVSDPNRSLNLDGLRLLHEVKTRLEGAPFSALERSVTHSLRAIRNGALDSSDKQSTFLLTEDDVSAINGDWLPVLNETLEALDAGFAFEPFEMTAGHMQAADLSATEPVRTVADAILPDLFLN